MLTFWRHGYETTSISDLTSAMGITPPSLYTAFGDKKQIFLEAVRLYVGDPETTGRAIDDAPTAYDAAHSLLIGAAIAYTGATTPRGCLLASATASGSTASLDVQRVVTAIRHAVSERLRHRIERDIQSGGLPKTTDSAALAGLVMTTMQGLSVMARDGVSRALLVRVVNTALKAWPNALEGA